VTDFDKQGNFAAAAEGWRWPILELEWISALATIVLFTFLPETLESTILHKRAQRLRKLTGNQNIRTQGEIDTESIPTTTYLLKSFARPLELAFKPAVLFANVYIGLVYAIFYLWFEAFPIVFNGIHGFRQGVSGLPYLSFVVAAIITFTFYCEYDQPPPRSSILTRLAGLYQKYHIEPRFVRDGGLAPEVRLEVALIGGICIPISLFIFGWTSRADIHWIFPIIGAAIYLPGIYLMFQGILIYLSMSYPKDAGSILAVNDLFRSTVASFFPLFGSSFFLKLGVGAGSSLLAGLSIALLPVLYGFIRWGHKLRPEQN
jgi:DHA1 family multidrug resistance protein-like MFS transporter